MVAELIDSVTYSLAEGNCLGLVAGEYSFQQIITALIDTVCDVATSPSIDVPEKSPRNLILPYNSSNSISVPEIRIFFSSVALIKIAIIYFFCKDSYLC